MRNKVDKEDKEDKEKKKEKKIRITTLRILTFSFRRIALLTFFDNGHRQRAGADENLHPSLEIKTKTRLIFCILDGDTYLELTKLL